MRLPVGIMLAGPCMQCTCSTVVHTFLLYLDGVQLSSVPSIKRYAHVVWPGHEMSMYDVAGDHAHAYIHTCSSRWHAGLCIDMYHNNGLVLQERCYMYGEELDKYRGLNCSTTIWG